MRKIAGLVLPISLAFSAPAFGEAAVPQPPAFAPHLRVLPLQGGQNFRDLGGYRTSDGRTVRWGLLYRSGSMHFLTDADYAYLEKLGIRTVCDFRDTRERSVEPSSWPAAAAPKVLADDYSLDLGGIGKTAPDHQPTAAEARTAIMATYPKLLAQFNEQYRRMFDELLAGQAPLAFNCTAGKDRTGIAAALILIALGVPRETVVEDYTLTNRTFDPAKVQRSDAKAANPWRSLPPDVLRAYMAADPAYIGEVFKVLDTHAGGAPGYLHDQFGLTPEKIRRLRNMYTSAGS
jgi:protein-tyrosine phosphatase